MAVSVKGNTSNVIYGKGDVCLKINPFDNFRLFTLYEDWRNDDPKPLDISNGQKLYLVFKSKKKEIRIPEYDIINSDYTVDKVNGQVLFKISKKNATDILSLDTNIFYITRLYGIIDDNGHNVASSDEEVLYTGLWKDETKNTIENYTAQVKNLMGLLEERNNQIKDLQDSNAKLMEQNTDFATQIVALKDENEKMSGEISDLEAKVDAYESGTEYAGTVLGDATYHTIINGKRYTEEQMEEVTRHLEDIYQN